MLTFFLKYFFDQMYYFKELKKRKKKKINKIKLKNGYTKIKN